MTRPRQRRFHVLMATAILLLLAAAGAVAACWWQPLPLRESLMRWDGGSGAGAVLATGFAWGDAWSDDPQPRFLARTQCADGRWDGRDRLRARRPGDPDDAADLRCTALVLLAFLGAGYDHRLPNRYQKLMQRGLAWLRAEIARRDWYRTDPHIWCLALYALGESYTVTNDPALRPEVEARCAALLAHRVADGDGMLRWIRPDDGHADLSLNLYAIMAVKAIQAGGIVIGGALEESRRWLQSFCEAGGIGSDEAVAASLLALWVGARGQDPWLTSLTGLARSIEGRTASLQDLERFWIWTAVCFQLGGEDWQRWQVQRDRLVDTQLRAPICLAGSWHPPPGTSRIAASALCALSLEHSYRSVPMVQP